MLREEQVAELLRRHEDVLQSHIKMIKGNLRCADNRAAQVWELIVLDAASHIGPVEYESHPMSSPDIKLKLGNNHFLWIEVAYIYPRFWQKERIIRSVIDWIFNHSKKLGIPPYKIHPLLNPREETEAGPILKLPKLNERKIFLADSEIETFFKQILNNPSKKQKISLTHYSMILEYNPLAHGPYLSWSGVLLETPHTVEQHAVYRVLKDKAKQHKMNEPHIVCIGSDSNRVLSNNYALESAIHEAFKMNTSITASIIVSFKDVRSKIIGWEKIPDPDLFLSLLSQKMGAPANYWRIRKMDVLTYQVEEICE